MPGIHLKKPCKGVFSFFYGDSSIDPASILSKRGSRQTFLCKAMSTALLKEKSVVFSTGSDFFLYSGHMAGTVGSCLFQSEKMFWQGKPMLLPTAAAESRLLIRYQKEPCDAWFLLVQRVEKLFRHAAASFSALFK